MLLFLIEIETGRYEMSKYIALIPAYNESKNIFKVIFEMNKYPRFKTIVVDDGSTDNTAEIARSAGVKVISHKKNKGKGEALNTGFRYILQSQRGSKYVVIIDADLQYMPSESMKVLKPIEEGKADLVMGYRDFGKIPFRHQLGNFVWRAFFNILFGTSFKDTNCGCMAMTTDAIRKIGKVQGGYIIENSILAEAVRKGLRVEQVPVNVTYRRLSRVPRGIRVVMGVFIFILTEGFKYRLGIK